MTGQVMDRTQTGAIAQKSRLSEMGRIWSSDAQSSEAAVETSRWPVGEGNRASVRVEPASMRASPVKEKTHHLVVSCRVKKSRTKIRREEAIGSRL